MNFKDKYIKYKSKYLQLKYQYGGLPDQEKTTGQQSRLEKLKLRRKKRAIRRKMLKREMSVKKKMLIEELKKKQKKLPLYKLPNVILQMVGDYLPVEDLNKMMDVDPQTAKIMAIDAIYRQSISYEDAVNPILTRSKVKYIIISNALQLQNLMPFQNLQEIIFTDTFDEEIKDPNYPPVVKKMTFGSYFNQPLKIGDLPNSLETLFFKSRYYMEYFSNFNQRIEANVLPPNLKVLILGNNFNNGGHPLEEKVLPNSLVNLTFGSNFKNGGSLLEASVLPPSLTLLSFIREYLYRNSYDIETTYVGVSVPLPLTTSLTLPNNTYNERDHEDILLNNGHHIFWDSDPYDFYDNPDIFMYNDPSNSDSDNMDQPD